MLARLLGTGSSRVPLVDVRCEAAFVARRVAGSACIPAPRLATHLFALPEKGIPVALLGSDRSQLSRALLELQEYGWQVLASFLVVEEDCVAASPSPPTSSSSSSSSPPTSSSPISPPSCSVSSFEAGDGLFPVSWKALELAGVELASSPPDTPLSEINAKLFRPCPALIELLPRIEDGLADLTEAGSVFRCLDVGCGSGRDMVYLASKPGRLRWSVMGLDARGVMLQNVHRFARWHGVDAWVSTRRAKLLGGGSIRFWADGALFSSSSSSPSSSSTATSPPSTLSAGSNEPETTKPAASSAPYSQTEQGACEELTATSPSSASSSSSPASTPSPSSKSASKSISESTAAPVSTANSSDTISMQDLGNTDISKYDLVLVIRMLERGAFATIASLVRPGGFLLYHTFVEGNHADSPSIAHLLKKGELNKVFREQHGFQVLEEREDTILDGRPMTTFLAQKPAAVKARIQPQHH